MRLKIKNGIHRLAKFLYGLLPFKKQIFHVLKALKIPNEPFYKYLTFRGKFRVQVGDKSFYIFHHGGSIENELFWKGLQTTWEEESLWLWTRLCRISKVIFDIGANTGIYTLIAKTINPSAKVIAFEPSKETYPKLSYNNSLNKMDSILEKIALSNTSGYKTFYDVFEKNQKSASLSPYKLKYFEGFKGKINEYPVMTDTLANYIQKNNINHIDLMKIDVELHEPEVIEGFGEYLIKFKPMIIIEVLTIEVAEKLNNIFEKTEYKIFHLNKKNRLQKVEKLFVAGGQWNFLLSPAKDIGKWEFK